MPSTLEYRLDLSIDYKEEKLKGRCEITILNKTGNPIEKIPLLLYRLLSVNSVSNEKGLPLKFKQDITCIENWERIQVNFIEISLEKSLPPGSKKTINISYEGFLAGYSAEGWRYVKDHVSRDFTMIRTDGFGYPAVGYPNEVQMMAIVKEKYDYTIKVTVPEKLKVVNGGELLSITKDKDEVTYSYKSKCPSWRIDIAIADYITVKNNSSTVFCFGPDSLAAVSMLDAVERTLETYSSWFGDIKDYKGYTIIEVPDGYGSQSDISSSCLTADNFINTKGYAGIYHELAHLWDVKPLEDEPCRFESEGRAQFLQFLLMQKCENKNDAVSDATGRYLDAIRKDFTIHEKYQSVPMKDYGKSDMTGYSYTLGMIVFSMFYDLAGQENFNKSIRSFTTGYRDKGATLGEFIACFKKNASFDSEKFFNEWVFTTAGVKFIMEGASYDDLLTRYK